MGKSNNQERSVALGARLKFLREQWQQSVHDVCNTLEIDEKQLIAYESGDRLPSPETLDMLISHFLLTEDQAQDLRDLAEDENSESTLPANLEEMLTKQIMMLMPVDNRIVYTDSMQATVNNNGVVLQFTQQSGNGQSVPVSRVGMSREHAEKIIEVLQNTLNHHNDKDTQDKPNSKPNSKTES